MAEIVQSLFGVSPEMYQRQQQDRADAQAMRFAQLDPFQQANFAIGRGANMLGGAIGGALGGQDPELQRVTMRQQIARQLNPGDPASIQQAIAALSQAGDAEGAMMLQGEYRKLQESNALVAQRGAAAQASGAQRQGADPFEQLVRTGKYTPASLAAYRQSGDVGQLELMEKTKDDVVVVGNALVSKSTGQPIYQGPDPQKYSGFAQELRDAGLEPGTAPFQNRMLEYVSGKIKGVAKGTGNVSVSVGGVPLNAAKASDAASKVVGENVANIENQFSLQTAVGDALTLLDKGIYAGAYGPEQGFVAKFTGIGSRDKVINTEQFFANIGEIVIPRLQQFGGNDSNEELKYLQRVVAGDQRLEPEAMKRILASAEKKIQNNIARLQKQAGGGQLPTGPMTPAAAPRSTPTPTQRYNPQTRKIEAISGD
jgi:hypothetical protein